ncbi:MAG: TA system VapC family ribonuclease toxin [Acidobacteriaceae bacterium]
MSRPRFLLDVNVLVALADEDHVHHPIVMKWFRSRGRHDWGLCAFTEAGFLRVSMRPKTGSRSIEEVTEMLTRLAAQPGYRYWPITVPWATLAAPFQGRLFGHQQITDAYLLGLAVEENCVLVTLDQALSHLAGAQYRRHLLVLQ